MTFELQPTLRGELLELRPLRLAHFDDLFAAASDPKIWEQHPASDRWQRPRFQHYFETAIASGGAFAILERKTKQIIGSSRYDDLQPGKQVEIGWTFLQREYWGGVYNRELKSLMLDHAFRFVPRGVSDRRKQLALTPGGGKDRRAFGGSGRKKRPAWRFTDERGLRA